MRPVLRSTLRVFIAVLLVLTTLQSLFWFAVEIRAWAVLPWPQKIIPQFPAFIFLSLILAYLLASLEQR